MTSHIYRTISLRAGILLPAIIIITVCTSPFWRLNLSGSGIFSGGESEQQSTLETFWSSNHDLMWLSPDTAPSMSLKSVFRNTATSAVTAVSGYEGASLKYRSGVNHYISGTNIIIRFGDSQTCHYLDIPPPATRFFL